jgi:hypothetical protein
MAWNDFAPQKQGKDLRVVTIDGPQGPFQIALAGTHSDGGTSYLYQDERARFEFYVEKHFKAKPWIDVKRALIVPSSRLSFKTSKENESIFRSNIELFFKTRSWTSASRRGDHSTTKVVVLFSWTIVQRAR